MCSCVICLLFLCLLWVHLHSLPDTLHLSSSALSFLTEHTHTHITLMVSQSSSVLSTSLSLFAPLYISLTQCLTRHLFRLPIFQVQVLLFLHSLLTFRSTLHYSGHYRSDQSYVFVHSLLLIFHSSRSLSSSTQANKHTLSFVPFQLLLSKTSQVTHTHTEIITVLIHLTSDCGST